MEKLGWPSRSPKIKWVEPWEETDHGMTKGSSIKDWNIWGGNISMKMAESKKLTSGFFLFLFTFSINLIFPLIEKKHGEKERKRL